MTSTKKIDSIVEHVQLIFVVLMYSIFSSHKQLIMKHEFRKNNENYKEFNIDYIHKKKIESIWFFVEGISNLYGKIPSFPYNFNRVILKK